MRWWDPDAMILVFGMLHFKSAFLSPLLPSSRGSLVPLHFLPLEWYLHIWGCWYFSWKSWFQLVLHPAQHFTWCTLHRSYTSRMTVCNPEVLFPRFGTSALLCVILEPKKNITCRICLGYLVLFFGLFSLHVKLREFLFTCLHIIYHWSLPQLFLLMSHQRHSSVCYCFFFFNWCFVCF